MDTPHTEVTEKAHGLLAEIAKLDAERHAVFEEREPLNDRIRFLNNEMNEKKKKYRKLIGDDLPLLIKTEDSGREIEAWMARHIGDDAGFKYESHCVDRETHEFRYISFSVCIEKDGDVNKQKANLLEWIPKLIRMQGVEKGVFGVFDNDLSASGVLKLHTDGMIARLEKLVYGQEYLLLDDCALIRAIDHIAESHYYGGQHDDEDDGGFC